MQLLYQFDYGSHCFRFFVDWLYAKQEEEGGEREDEIEEKEDEENGGNVGGTGEGKLILFLGDENLTLDDVLNVKG